MGQLKNIAGLSLIVVLVGSMVPVAFAETITRTAVERTTSTDLTTSTTTFATTTSTFESTSTISTTSTSFTSFTNTETNTETQTVTVTATAGRNTDTETNTGTDTATATAAATSTTTTTFAVTTSTSEFEETLSTTSTTTSTSLTTIEIPSTTTTTLPQNEGCTPGFWKTHTDTSKYPNAWPPTGNEVDDSFSSVFGRVITILTKVDADGDKVQGKPFEVVDPTLIQALNAVGGDINALARHAVAAKMNALHPDISAGIALLANVIAIFQDGFDPNGRTIEEAKNELAASNELGCPISGQEPVD